MQALVFSSCFLLANHFHRKPRQCLTCGRMGAYEILSLPKETPLLLLMENKSQPVFSCSKPTMETPEQCEKSVQI